MIEEPDDFKEDGEDGEEEVAEVVFVEGFDEAILGVARQSDRFFVVYDYRKVIQILSRTMNQEDAWIYFEKNMLNEVSGGATPAYLVNKARDPME